MFYKVNHINDQMSIKGILFDYGNTLISVELDWAHVLPCNIRNLVNYLRIHHIPVNEDDFGKSFLIHLNSYLELGRQTLIEFPAKTILQQTLWEFQINHLPQKFLQEAIDAYYQTEEESYQLIENAHKILNDLYSKGYKMAIVSNAFSGDLIRTSLQRHDLMKYFDVVIVSADIGYRKPHAKIFQYALDKLQLFPRETVMVGDVPAYDIYGAKSLGIKTILVKYQNSSEAKSPHKHDFTQPDAWAHHISDIPFIISQWNNIPIQ